MDRPAFVTLEPYRPEMEAALVAAAVADQHTVILPTHVMVRGGELAGYLSMGAASLTVPWFHTQKMRARDTVQMINTAENLLRLAGRPWSAVPFALDSPLRPLMPALGYKSVGVYDFGLKQLS